MISNCCQSARQVTESIQPQPLQIDIVSDVVCPWCIIGYKQFEKALAQLPGQFEVSLDWRPFELNPDTPREGQDLREHVMQKYGATAEQSDAVRAELALIGAALGFRFDYFDGMRMVNSFHSHQLLRWAGEQGLQTELALALFEAFFSLREDVSEDETLARLAGKVGLSSASAMEVLADARYADAVRAEQKLWLGRNISAAPTFVFNQQYMLQGAQDAKIFVQVLSRIKDEFQKTP